MVRAIDMKYKATGPLADIVGTRAMKRGQMMKKIWKEIDAADIQGVEGDTAKDQRPCRREGRVRVTCRAVPAARSSPKAKREKV